MAYMLEKLFHNADLDIDLTSFIDNKQNVWFKGKDVALIHGYILVMLLRDMYLKIII